MRYLVILLSLLAALPAAAQSKTTTTTGGLWSDPANWDNGVPDAVDQVYVELINEFSIMDIPGLDINEMRCRINPFGQAGDIGLLVVDEDIVMRTFVVQAFDGGIGFLRGMGKITTEEFITINVNVDLIAVDIIPSNSEGFTVGAAGGTADSTLIRCKVRELNTVNINIYCHEFRFDNVVATKLIVFQGKAGYYQYPLLLGPATGAVANLDIGSSPPFLFTGMEIQNVHAADPVNATDSTDLGGNVNISFSPTAASGVPVPASVGQNYPNPFNPTTVIEYQLPSGQTSGLLKIWDVSGREVKEFQLSQPSGSVVWDAQGHASGVYLYQVGNQAKKMALVK